MFKETNLRALEGSPVKMIAEDWALLTAGNEAHFNTMTVSWGGVGELWGRDVAFVFVRPQRYTYEFMENSDTFTLTFFGGDYKKELGICGKVSGRDTDKVKETGLTPWAVENGVSFKEAKTVMVCKKIAVSDMKPESFLDESIKNNYHGDDYHRIYVGEVLKVYVAE